MEQIRYPDASEQGNSVNPVSSEHVELKDRVNHITCLHFRKFAYKRKLPEKESSRILTHMIKFCQSNLGRIRAGHSLVYAMAT